MTQAGNAANTVYEFEQLLLDRFAALTRQRKVTDRQGRVLGRVIDPHRGDHGGYGRWGLKPGWTADLDVTRVESGCATFVHVLERDDTRAMTTTVREFEVPWALLAVDPETDENYTEFLRLKAIYEPAARTGEPVTPNGMAPACSSCQDALTDRAPDYCGTPAYHRPSRRADVREDVEGIPSDSPHNG